MTLILKTTSSASGLVGNIHGNTGPQDYVAMLDFARGEYFTRVGGARVDYPLTDLITVTRSGDPAHYRDRYGVWKQAPQNTPRFRYDAEDDAYGLFVGAPRKNHATAETDGAAVSVPSSSSTRILVSWRGAGQVDLNGSNTTFEESWQFGDQKAAFYVRPGSSNATTGTITVTGSISDLQIEEALDYPSERLGFGLTTGRDTVELAAPLLSLIGSAGTIFLRTVHPRARMLSSTFSVGHMIALKTDVGQGGVYLRTRDGNQTTATNDVWRIPDGGAINSGSSSLNFTVSGRPSGTVRGLAWRDQGDVVSGMTGGMFLEASGLGSASPFARVRIAGDASSWNQGANIDTIITHCVIYDRYLTYDEMSVMATMWQN